MAAPLLTAPTKEIGSRSGNVTRVVTARPRRTLVTVLPVHVAQSMGISRKHRLEGLHGCDLGPRLRERAECRKRCYRRR